MKALVFLTIGAIWLIAAIILRRTGFAIAIRPDWGLNPAAVAGLLPFFMRVLTRVLFFGWIVPFGISFWFLLARR